MGIGLAGVMGFVIVHQLEAARNPAWTSSSFRTGVALRPC